MLRDQIGAMNKDFKWWAVPCLFTSQDFILHRVLYSNFLKFKLETWPAMHAKCSFIVVNYKNIAFMQWECHCRILNGIEIKDSGLEWFKQTH